MRLVEVGCGFGRTLALIRLADPIDWAELRGFDLNPALIEAGRRRLGLGRELTVADAMGYDFGAADVVYAYRPFIDDDLQARFEAHLQESMKVSAYLLSPMALRDPGARRLIPVGGGGTLYKKIA